MPKYIFHWKTGKDEVISGRNISDAFNKAGYSAGALRALDYYELQKGKQNENKDC
jgi:hypothetical protein